MAAIPLIGNPTENADAGRESLIQMNDIVKIFHTAAGEFTALKGISTKFNRGEFVSVVGKSGSGKSTLVNMITGIDRPTSGAVSIEGMDIHTLPESKMAVWRGRNLGIVFQFYQLLPMLSLLENVMLPMQIANMHTSAEREKRALELLDMVGLHEHAYKRPVAVSGGQQQSAAIARALANDPPIIVADEPTGNLDTRAAEIVFHIFERLIEHGKTIIMVTHDNALAQRATRTLLISDGEVINETIANTLPLLTHGQMLRATKHHEPMVFQPGETIIKQGTPNDYFYMITEGLIDVTLERENAEVKVASLGPGQYFGEVTLLRGADAVAIASIHATQHRPVEVLALNRAVFNELMEEATAMREELIRVARERLTVSEPSDDGA